MKEKLRLKFKELYGFDAPKSYSINKLKKAIESVDNFKVQDRCFKEALNS